MLPGWNSLESVARWHAFFEVAGIVSLGALVLMEIGALTYGHRKEALAAAEADGRVEAVKKQIAPRKLSGEAARRFADRLRAAGVGAVRIGYSAADVEAKSFAEELHAAITSAGWRIERRGVLRLLAKDAEGLFLGLFTPSAVPDPADASKSILPPEAVPAALGALKDAIEEAGFQVSVQLHLENDLPEGMISLWVGKKPQSR